jgi:glycosyltransferase involved in cell wall biosynthesis
VSVIVPTLNEEKHVGLLLSSLRDQSLVNYEALLIDGGSVDNTSGIAEQYGAKVTVIPGCSEFASRNFGAMIAKGKFLLFTCADIVFPPELLARIVEKFEQAPELVALTGPGCPFDAPLIGRAEYAVYNLLRFVLAKLPRRLRRFSTSTNFLVVREDCFNNIGGFDADDINADGLMGKKLLERGEVTFSFDTYVFLSARRMKDMGFLNFNRHYLYSFENIFFFLSGTGLLRSLKSRSKMKHRKIHEI